MSDVLHVETALVRAGRRRPLRTASLVRTLGPAVLFCALAALGWEGMARALHNPLIPHVAEVQGEIVRIITDGLATSQILVTIGRIGGGLMAAAAIALAVGMLSARSAQIERFFEPAIILGLTVPGLVWALLCIIWFGVSYAAPVTAIALGVSPALALHVSQGLRSVDGELLEMAQVFKLSPVTRLRVVWLPSLLPFLFSGLRLGLSLSWKVIVLVELFGLSSGVGYQLNSEFGAQNVAGVLAWTIVFWLVMAALEYGVLQALERASTRWRTHARTDRSA